MNILIRNQQRHRHLDKSKITRAAHSILSLLEKSLHAEAELSILFVGDGKMLELNSEYRGIKKSTDVLSFEARVPVKHDKINAVLGDIVISVPRAESQAETSGTGFYHEIYRLLIHGILHLLGYEHDKSPYRARKMRKKEQEIMNALAQMD